MGTARGERIPHLVRPADVVWILDAPDHVVPTRACIRCGLRDTFIDEGEADLLMVDE